MTVRHRARWIRPQQTDHGTPLAVVTLPLDQEVPRGWTFWLGFHTNRVKKLFITDDGTYKQRTTNTTASTRFTSAILNSCEEYDPACDSPADGAAKEQVR